MRVRDRLRLFAFLALLGLSTASASNAADTGAGLRKLEVVDPLGGAAMDVVAIYPSAVDRGAARIGPFDVAGSKAAPLAGGRFPLILMSHGSSGSLWGQHDLATFLARRGYVVVGVTHPGDNYEDRRRLGSTASLYGRPLQISASLTAALEDPVLAAHIDRDRIGFIGFSAGGTTGLILAGARPDIRRLVAYCSARPNDRGVCEAQGRIDVDPQVPEPSPDRRFRSLVLLAPLSVILTPDTVKSIAIPVLIRVGEQDEELDPKENAGALSQAIGPSADFQTIPAAGHSAFLAPCSTSSARETPALCVDPPGLDRVDLHQHLNADISDFFARTLMSQPQ